MLTKNYLSLEKAKLTGFYLSLLTTNILVFDAKANAIEYQDEPQQISKIRKPLKELSGQGVKVAVIDADFAKDHANHVSSIIRSVAKNAEQKLIDMENKSPLRNIEDYDSYLIAALNTAIESEVDFINISLRISPDADERRDDKISEALKRAFYKARDANIGIIKSAGNDNEFIGVTPYTQSLTELLEEMNGSMILVVATEKSHADNEDLANFTRTVMRGKEIKHFRTKDESNKAGLAHAYTVAAPGANILGYGANNRLVTMSGTSMAAPFVTGVASALKEACPVLSAREILTSIRKSARKATMDKKISLPTGKYGCGIVNLQEALIESEKMSTIKNSL